MGLVIDAAARVILDARPSFVPFHRRLKPEAHASTGFLPAASSEWRCLHKALRSQYDLAATLQTVGLTAQAGDLIRFVPPLDLMLVDDAETSGQAVLVSQQLERLLVITLHVLGRYARKHSPLHHLSLPLFPDSLFATSNVLPSPAADKAARSCRL